MNQYIESLFKRLQYKVVLCRSSQDIDLSSNTDKKCVIFYYVLVLTLIK